MYGIFNTFLNSVSLSLMGEYKKVWIKKQIEHFHIYPSNIIESIYTTLYIS